MGQDLLLEFHAQPLGCMHAWGVARARHSRASLRSGPFRTIPDSLRSPQGFEMRVAGPIAVSRQSKIGSHPPCTNTIGATGWPKIGKLPAPSRHRSPTRSQTVRASRHSPITVSRWSRIGRLDRLRQHVHKHLSDRIPQDRQAACAVAPSLPHDPAPCARQPAQSHHRFSMVENRPPRPPAPTCVQASV